MVRWRFSFGVPWASLAVVLGAVLVHGPAQAQVEVPAAVAAPDALPPPPPPPPTPAVSAQPAASDGASASDDESAPSAPSRPSAVETMPPGPSGPPLGGLVSPYHGRQPARSLAPVFVSVSAGARSFIVFGDEQRRVAECDQDCQFWAWPGTYRVRLKKTEHEPETSATLRVRYSGAYTFKIGDSATRDTGLALGIIGSVAFVVGTFVTFIGALEYDCAGSDSSVGPPSSCNTPASVYEGLGTMVAGAGLSATGFVLFGVNGTGFHYNREPLLVPMSARIGPVPLPGGGLGLGGTLSF